MSLALNLSLRLATCREGKNQRVSEWHDVFEKKKKKKKKKETVEWQVHGLSRDVIATTSRPPRQWNMVLPVGRRPRERSLRPTDLFKVFTQRYTP
jgi:hypothetical protein